MSIYTQLGNQIKSIRTKQRLTQEELSSNADISNHFLSKIENGKEKASLETVHKIAKALKVPVSGLFSLNEIPNKLDLSDRKIAAILKSLNPKTKIIAIEIFKEIGSKLRKL